MKEYKCHFCGKVINPFSNAKINSHILAPVEGKYVPKCLDCQKVEKNIKENN